jgi:hypothetical protein
MGGGVAVTDRRSSQSPLLANFEFEAFKALTCGCVAAVHRTLDPSLAVVSLEAKGSYCGLMEHVVGRATAVPSAVTDRIELPELNAA